MDLSVEAEAFGSEIRWSEYENPTVSGSIASTLDEIEKLKIPEAGSGRTGEVLRCVELCAAGCDRPVLGGMIGPFSLAGRLADMTEIMILAGGGAGDGGTAAGKMYRVPDRYAGRSGRREPTVW